MRFLRSILLFVPLALLAGAAFWLYLNVESRINRWAHNRYVESCRNQAAGLVRDPELGETSRRMKGLRSLGRIDDIKFGCNVIGDERMVWIEFRPGYIRFAPTETEVVDVGDWMFAAGIVLILLLAAATFLGIRSFNRDIRARDEFLSASAHDLLTPLVALRFGYDRQLVERLVCQVRNISDFVRSGGRPRRPHLSVFPLKKALDNAYALFAGAFADAESGPVAIECEEGLTVKADEELVFRIIFNLLDNALKYAAHLGPVEMVASKGGKYVKIEVRDHGKGLDAWQRWRCFGRYYRAVSSLSSGKGGFGIGLANARQFAKAMRGSLTVRPNVPSGCIFTLSLPV